MTHIRFLPLSSDSSVHRLLISPVLVLLLLCAACAPIRQPDSPGTPSQERPPDLSADSLEGLAAALEAQCSLSRLPTTWPALCSEFRRERHQLRSWLMRRFEWQSLRDGKGTDTGLITGYFEPELTGSRLRENAQQVPLRRLPPADSMLLRATRAQIEDTPPDAGEVLVWVDDAVDAFFLQVQGSGRIRLRDGTVLRAGYAGDNGHAYRAIGRDLIERGVLTPASLSAQAIAAWLRSHPQEGRDVMQMNPRYVFFRESPPTPRRALTACTPVEPQACGPVGSMGVPLTPMRSVAVDPKTVPLGSLLWLEAPDPRGGQLRRLVLAQDTGAAIVGSPRADLFWGTGREAGESAGLMKSPGRLWWLKPRP